MVILRDDKLPNYQDGGPIANELIKTKEFYKTVIVPLIFTTRVEIIIVKDAFMALGSNKFSSVTQSMDVFN